MVSELTHARTRYTPPNFLTYNVGQLPSPTFVYLPSHWDSCDAMSDAPIVVSNLRDFVFAVAQLKAYLLHLEHSIVIAFAADDGVAAALKVAILPSVSAAECFHIHSHANLF